VEGSESPPPARGARPLERIWNELLPDALRIARFAAVIPISKTHLVAEDPNNPPISGAGESLSKLMVRMMGRFDYQSAIICWDLHPSWNADGNYCRWDETVALYRGLVASELPPPWRNSAATRLEELLSRPTPNQRQTLPALQRHGVLPLCMEPKFESLLVQDESAARRALGIHGRRVPSWPTSGWADPKELQPDRRILDSAVRAVRRLRPSVRGIAGVRQSWEHNKDGWGEFLLRRMLGDEEARQCILQHPICRRLAEIGLASS